MTFALIPLDGNWDWKIPFFLLPDRLAWTELNLEWNFSWKEINFHWNYYMEKEGGKEKIDEWREWENS